jgi:hypothetical protein
MRAAAAREGFQAEALSAERCQWMLSLAQVLVQVELEVERWVVWSVFGPAG